MARKNQILSLVSQEENRRTSKLFLMLPPQVIDTVLPIRNYILHGSRVKRAAIEEVVRENEQKMQRILETAADGFLEFDADGLIKQINQAAERMMNLSTSALLGEKIFSIFSTRSAREVLFWLLLLFCVLCCSLLLPHAYSCFFLFFFCSSSRSPPSPLPFSSVCWRVRLLCTP